MQRFKDFTKKSGKVASAILSAAMVTSMVAGTNVIQAAEVNTVETNVTAPSTDKPSSNAVVEQVAAAKAEIIAAYKDLPVTSQTFVTYDKDKLLTKADGLKDFYQPALDVKDDYKVTVSVEDIDVTTKAPTATSDGEAVLTLKVTSDTDATYDSGEFKIVYKLDNLTKRVNAAKAKAEVAMKEVPATNVLKDTDLTDAATKALANAKADSLYNSIPEFDDIATPTKESFDLEHATLNGTGSVKSAIKITSLVSATETADAIYDEVIASNTDRANVANKAVATYLGTDLRFADASTDADADVKSIVENFLALNDYPDVVVDTDATNEDACKFTLGVKPNATNDGSATVNYTLITQATATDGDIATKDIASAGTNDVAITLLGDESKTNKGLADLKAVAEKVEMTPEMTEAEYEAAFTDALADLEKYSQTADGSKELKLASKNVENFDQIYAGAIATVDYIAKDASANKDANPKATIKVTSGTQTATAEVEYTYAGAATEVAKAQVAVEAALANMTITNDTKDEDVLAVVNETLKAYPDVKAKLVTFDKADATADKEGTATIKVELTDTKNGITKEAKAEKTFAFKSNTFVEENGKKYYYGKDGKLATTDKGYFLQGTDSPDGYTYFIQNDGSVMQDRLTYHPDGEHVIYFDKDGHEVFDAFVNVKKDAQGQDVDYIGYFDTFGYAYVNQTTYGNGEGAYATDALFYINDYGVLENKGWFQNAAGEIGYAATNGTLTTSQWSLDQFGRKVYFQANGFLAKGLMTDGVKYYQLDENDGHLVGEF